MPKGNILATFVPVIGIKSWSS